MSEEKKAGCARPTGGLVGESPKKKTEKEISNNKMEGIRMIKVG